jgi:hypothetical protein
VISEWIVVEHHRLHLVEAWPHSARKDATLAAIYSSLSSLDRNWRTSARHDCLMCLSEAGNVHAFPETARVGPRRDEHPRPRTAVSGG